MLFLSNAFHVYPLRLSHIISTVQSIHKHIVVVKNLNPFQTDKMSDKYFDRVKGFAPLNGN